MMLHEEHSEQSNVIKWWKFACKKYKVPEEFLFAIPNGGKRSIQTACTLKSEGVRAGIPDLFLAVETYKSAGLFIEMKKKKGGVVSDSQKYIIELLKNNTSYCVKVCHGFDDAKQTIEKYLSKGEV